MHRTKLGVEEARAAMKFCPECGEPLQIRQDPVVSVSYCEKDGEFYVGERLTGRLSGLPQIVWNPNR